MNDGNERLISIEEVAVQLGVSYKTICNWYAFKRKYPDDEWSKKLPDYVLGGEKNTKRLWKQSDIVTLMDFRDTLPKGRNGIMGKVTQVWYHKRKEGANDNN